MAVFRIGIYMFALMVVWGCTLEPRIKARPADVPSSSRVPLVAERHIGGMGVLLLPRAVASMVNGQEVYIHVEGAHGGTGWVARAIQEAGGLPTSDSRAPLRFQVNVQSFQDTAHDTSGYPSLELWAHAEIFVERSQEIVGRRGRQQGSFVVVLFAGSDEQSQRLSQLGASNLTRRDIEDAAAIAVKGALWKLDSHAEPPSLPSSVAGMLNGRDVYVQFEGNLPSGRVWLLKAIKDAGGIPTNDPSVSLRVRAHVRSTREGSYGYSEVFASANISIEEIRGTSGRNAYVTLHSGGADGREKLSQFGRGVLTRREITKLGEDALKEAARTMR